jgi:hypothetical protein
MAYAGVWTFIVGTIVVGLGIGIYLQGKLEGSNQNIKLPSAFGAKESQMEKEIVRQNSYA